MLLYSLICIAVGLMMSTLNIRLLGHFQLTYNDKRVISIKGTRLQALVAYLLLHRGRALTRHSVAIALWSDSEHDQVRSNLRTKLNQLRKKFPAIENFLYTDNDILQWRMDAPFTLDVAEFEQAIQRVEQAKRAHDPVTILAALKEAVDLYTDDLLLKLHDDWILKVRQRLRAQFFSALEALITLLQNQQDYSAAIYYAHRLIHDNPLSEVAYRQLMELYFLNGDYPGAIHAYETCKVTLQRALKIAPSPATEAMYHRIVAAFTCTPLVAPLNYAPAPHLPASTVYELQVLAAAWLADSHQPAFAGVTYFLAQLATLLAANGQTVEALHMLDRAFILLTTTGETFWEAELHRLRGKLLWQHGEAAPPIEACFHKAIAIARHQNAKFQELCAVATLCLFWQHTTKYTTAQQQLVDLYTVFRSHYTKDEWQAVVDLCERFV